MQHSEQIDKLAGALAKVQASLLPATKDAENPFFKSKYADLNSVWNACREGLSANGLAVVQSPGPCGGNQVEMTTMLTHSSGQWIAGTLSIPLAKVDPQSYGSATTYARRYALAAMVGVVADDDDGNAAAQPSQTAAANDEPAARAKLNGPHTSKTALRKAINEIIAKVRAAQSDAEIDAIQREHIATIKQANTDWPALLTGDPNIPEDIGLKGTVQLKREELANSDDGQFKMLVDSMKQCETLSQLTNWMATNEALIAELDGAESRKFELAYQLHESGVVAVQTVNAG